MALSFSNRFSVYVSMHWTARVCTDIMCYRYIFVISISSSVCDQYQSVNQCLPVDVNLCEYPWCHLPMPWDMNNEQFGPVAILFSFVVCKPMEREAIYSSGNVITNHSLES